MYIDLLNIENITSNEIVIAIVGYVIVFIALVLLYSLFKTLPRILYMKLKKKKSTDKETKIPKGEMISGEETAAIALALQMYFDELHDEESGVLTIKKVSKAYSPWSSKIYGLRRWPHKTF